MWIIKLYWWQENIRHLAAASFKVAYSMLILYILNNAQWLQESDTTELTVRTCFNKPLNPDDSRYTQVRFYVPAGI